MKYACNLSLTYIWLLIVSAYFTYIFRKFALEEEFHTSCYAMIDKKEPSKTHGDGYTDVTSLFTEYYLWGFYFQAACLSLFLFNLLLFC